jgi:hypothetical protein
MELLTGHRQTERKEAAKEHNLANTLHNRRRSEHPNKQSDDPNDQREDSDDYHNSLLGNYMREDCYGLVIGGELSEDGILDELVE